MTAVTPKKRDWRPAFLEAFRNSANVRAACQSAGISRQTAYRTRHDDTKFAAEWAEAEADAVDILEAVAVQRAKTTSDTLLIFLLKAHRPEKYRDRVTVDVSLRDEAARLASELGIDVDLAIAEAERVLAEAR